jgi:PAS domain S-box-containing protein
MPTPLHILIVEDSDDDLVLLVRELQSGGYAPVYQRVQTAEAMRAALDQHPWDVILSDYTVPQFGAPAALALLHERGLDLPFIIISGLIGEAAAIAALKAGAHDIIIKGQYARLLPAIARELREAKGRRARRQAELALRESEARFRRLAEHAQDLIYRYRLRPTPGFDYVSPAAAAMTGYAVEDYYADPLLGFKLVHPEDAPLLQALFRDPAAVTNPLILRWLRKDGTLIWTEHRIVPIADAEGAVMTIEGIARDITVRKEAEARFFASLREKEVLLQEVHHRVKNNLQVIASLLRLQSYTVTDTAMRELLRDSQNRVHAMALVHEWLYQAHDLAHVDFATYLRELAASVLRSYEDQSAQIALEFATDDAVALDIDTAIPLGLILTELVSNSVKHAFPNGRTGTITIGLHLDADHLVLRISDTGVGLPESLDLQTTNSLGLQLVGDLAEQLGGRVRIERCGGATFQIRIPQR